MPSGAIRDAQAAHQPARVSPAFIEQRINVPLLVCLRSPSGELNAPGFTKRIAEDELLGLQTRIDGRGTRTSASTVVKGARVSAARRPGAKGAWGNRLNAEKVEVFQCALASGQRARGGGCLRGRRSPLWSRTCQPRCTGALGPHGMPATYQSTKKITQVMSTMAE